MNTLRVVLKNNAVLTIDLSSGFWVDSIRNTIEKAGYKYPKDILRYDNGEDAPDYRAARQLKLRECCS